ncbi:hypothetical protein [Oligoflexus tunisiensis]|uniref:hypothetical protein n=1 Tax=Oligoflexus tunisiensis TaxID=708132 RepID=UPI00114CB524|nr:hypothetical protein [Oligoflexus tunisiensis]
MLKLCLLTAVFGFSSLASAQAIRKADLVPSPLTYVKITPLPDGAHQLTAKLKVTNKGNRTASGYKLSVDAKDHNDSTFYHTGLYIGSKPQAYAYSPTALAAGASEMLTLNVYLRERWTRRLVNLYIDVDSCAGEEFQPNHCRVAESNEKNNRTPTFNVIVVPN